MFTPSPYRVIRAGESFRMLGNGISAAAALVTSEENPSASATAADPGHSIAFSLALIRDSPQKAALCPGQVCYLHDHFRPHPMHARKLQRRAKPRAGVL